MPSRLACLPRKAKGAATSSRLKAGSGDVGHDAAPDRLEKGLGNLEPLPEGALQLAVCPSSRLTGVLAGMEREAHKEARMRVG
jgi:hypothetical protein